MANIKRANTSGITKSGIAIPDVPDAPTIGAATNVGTSRAYNNGSATVAFTASATGGTPASYTATSTPGSYTASGAGSPLTVTGLQSATSYTFAVTATNASATGPASSSSSSITATTVPQAPTIGTASLISGGAVSVPFTTGATGGSAITIYTVTSSSTVTATGASSPITVTETVNGSYTYTVTATNTNGTSAASSASNSVTTAIYSGPTALEYVVLAGGASGAYAGGAAGAGGGGAGGFLTGSGFAVSAGTYNVEVGGGGAGTGGSSNVGQEIQEVLQLLVT